MKEWGSQGKQMAKCFYAEKLSEKIMYEKACY